jgi:hypothetical protein
MDQLRWKQDQNTKQAAYMATNYLKNLYAYQFYIGANYRLLDLRMKSLADDLQSPIHPENKNSVIRDINGINKAMETLSSSFKALRNANAKLLLTAKDVNE